MLQIDILKWIQNNQSVSNKKSPYTHTNTPIFRQQVKIIHNNAPRIILYTFFPLAQNPLNYNAL